ncbi:MAG TPA: transporter substrate-binding domain-containing protein, partial [Bacteroidales bacterium]|nr:transporter substrate-binding domain-containing protein [Bacteroidales bacterium]
MKNKILLLLSFIMYGLVANNTLAQTYVVGGDYDYAPITFLDDDGNARGLDVDILNTIERRRDVNFDYKLSEWDSALNFIQSGEIDILTGIIFSEEREELVDFTIPIHTEYYSVFIRDDLNFNDISSLYD